MFVLSYRIDFLSSPYSRVSFEPLGFVSLFSVVGSALFCMFLVVADEPTDDKKDDKDKTTGKPEEYKLNRDFCYCTIFLCIIFMAITIWGYFNYGDVSFH